MARTKSKNTWNGPIAIVGFAIYGALLILFGWQTWQFVNFLFPDDQLLMKVLTFISFDFMALVWAVVHTFYRFAHRDAKRWVLVTWIVTFILSLVASILYLVIQSFFRFQIAISQDMINTGYAISIAALVFNILALMAWLVLEYRVRHPRQDEFDLYEDEDEQEDEQAPIPMRPATSTAPVASATQGNRAKAAWNTLTGKNVPQPASEIDYDKLAQAMQRTQQQSPLAQPPLDTTQASQPGTNGNGTH